MPASLQLHVSPRGRLERPELVLAPGPSAEAAPGAGSFADLYGHVWALAWDRTRPELALLRVDAGELVEVDPLEALPELTRPARHISLAFDGSARPVVAWQSPAGLYVRQWDGFASEYTVRGPFAGADPCLVADAVPRITLGGADVVLYYVSEDRGSVHARLERDTYGVEYDVQELPASSSGASWYLDQVVMLDYRVRLELATDEVEDRSLPLDAQDLERLRFDSDLYPLRSLEGLDLELAARGAYDKTTELETADAGLDLELAARGEYTLTLFLQQLDEGLDLELAARGTYVATIFLEDDAAGLDLELAARGFYDQTTATGTDADGLDLELAARGEYTQI